MFKYFYPLMLLFLNAQCILGQNLNDSTLIILPPNGVWLHDNFYIDATEIANIHWLEYISDHYRPDFPQDSVIDKAILWPDTTIWASDNPYLNDYLFYPGYRFYPVVGITQQQALNFCAWRSKIVTGNLQREIAAKRKHPYRDYDIKFVFRLPTEEEWEMAASFEMDSIKYPYGYENLYYKPYFSGKAKNIIHRLDTLVDLKTLKEDVKVYKKGLSELGVLCKTTRDIAPYFIQKDTTLTDPKVTEYIFCSRPNQLGVYNMIGNVAEMVQEEGVAKGGSWIHDLEDCKIKNRIYYTQPKNWLGFRCVCEVVIKKKL